MTPTVVRLPFRDREEAGRLLGVALLERLGADRSRAAVFGIPRGGMVVAAVVATQLGAPLDVVVARKIGAPDHPELAVGAATADGTIFIEAWAAGTGADEAYLAEAGSRAVAEAIAREALLRAGRPGIALAGRVAVVVDDGIATGATLRAALLAMRPRGALRTVAAVPVGAADSVARLAHAADELVVLATPEPFFAVGEWYRRFDQTTDEEVLALLGRATQTQPTRDRPNVDGPN